MRNPLISLEELNPDNQDRSQDYYLGVSDACTYVLDILHMTIPSLRFEDMDPCIQAVVGAVDTIRMSMADRRSLWFANHVGVEHDPVGQDLRKMKKMDIKKDAGVPCREG